MTQQEQQKVFTQWLSEHKGLFFKIVRSFTQSKMEEDDLFQEIAVQVWRSVPCFKNKSAVSTWIYRVALNTAITWTTRENKQREQNKQIQNDGFVLEAVVEEQDSRLDWLYGEVAKMNEVDRSVALLLLDGYSYKEMAEIIGISEGAIGVKIHRIKKHLTEQSKNM